MENTHLGAQQAMRLLGRAVPWGDAGHLSEPVQTVPTHPPTTRAQRQEPGKPWTHLLPPQNLLEVPPASRSWDSHPCSPELHWEG